MAFMWVGSKFIWIYHAIKNMGKGPVVIECCNRCGRQKDEWKYCKRCGNPELRKQRVVVLSTELTTKKDNPKVDLS